MSSKKITETTVPKVEYFYAPTAGSFSRFSYNSANNTITLADDGDHGEGEFESCREIFLDCFFNSKVTQFLFSHPKDKRQNLIDFMNAVEDRLGNKRSRIKILPTARATVSIVYVTQWWRKDDMRRALLTILLRCGRNYNLEADNFQEALYSDKYAKQTKEAVEAFFRGRTVYKGSNAIDGWVTLFGDWLHTDRDAYNRKFYKENLNNLVFEK